jgi:hypothetical protein
MCETTPTPLGRGLALARLAVCVLIHPRVRAVRTHSSVA